MQSSGDQSSSDDVSWFRLVLKVTQGVLKPDAEAGDDASWFRFALGDIARQRICRRPPNPIIRLTQAAVLGGIAFERIPPSTGPTATTDAGCSLGGYCFRANSAIDRPGSRD